MAPVYFVFAILNLVVCLPLHLWLSRFARIAASRPVEAVAAPAPIIVDNRNFVFILIVLGFSLAGFVSAATLFHMVPMLGLLGLGAAGIWVASLLGPAQVASRLINMAFGKDVSASVLAVVSAVTIPLALGTLALSAPSTFGAAAFAIIFGLGSGLFSIVSGTLPLAIFGKDGFGKRLGWIGLGRLGLSALAPFALSVALGMIGPKPSLWILAVAGLMCVVVFAEVWRRCRPLGQRW